MNSATSPSSRALASPRRRVHRVKKPSSATAPRTPRTSPFAAVVAGSSALDAERSVFSGMSSWTSSASLAPPPWLQLLRGTNGLAAEDDPDALRRRLAATHEENDLLRSRLRTELKERQLLELKVASLTEKLAEAKRGLTTTTAALQQVQTATTQLIARREEREAALQDALAANAALERKVSELELSAAQSKGTDAVTGRLVAVENDLHETRTQLTALRRENLQLRDAAADAEYALETKKKRIAALEEQLLSGGGGGGSGGGGGGSGNSAAPSDAAALAALHARDALLMTMLERLQSAGSGQGAAGQGADVTGLERRLAQKQAEIELLQTQLRALEGDHHFLAGRLQLLESTLVQQMAALVPATQAAAAAVSHQSSAEARPGSRSQVFVIKAPTPLRRSAGVATDAALPPEVISALNAVGVPTTNLPPPEEAAMVSSHFPAAAPATQENATNADPTPLPPTDAPPTRRESRNTLRRSAGDSGQRPAAAAAAAAATTTTAGVGALTARDITTAAASAVAAVAHDDSASPRSPMTPPGEDTTRRKRGDVNSSFKSMLLTSAHRSLALNSGGDATQESLVSNIVKAHRDGTLDTLGLNVTVVGDNGAPSPASPTRSSPLRMSLDSVVGGGVESSKAAFADDVAVRQLQTERRALRDRIMQWREDFVRLHGREPTRQDREGDADAVSLYRQYKEKSKEMRALVGRKAGGGEDSDV